METSQPQPAITPNVPMSWMAHFAVALVAYSVMGQLGLTLAIPPGFASAVWPAAGVALALYIVYPSWGTVAGTMAGSFFTNLFISLQGVDNIDPTIVIGPMLIASGACVQLKLGHNLFIRKVGQESLLDSPLDILQFILYVGLAGCLVGSTVGVTTLVLVGAIDSSMLLFTWFTWYVGDTIGVLLFTPMVIALISDSDALPQFRRIQVVVPTVIIFLGVWALFLVSNDRTHHEREVVMGKQADELYKTIRERLTISLNKLAAYEAFYNASNKVTFSEFMGFSASIMSQDEAFHGIGFTRIIQDKDRRAVEREIRQHGFPKFRFTELTPNGDLIPAKKRDIYHPVLYIHPLDRNWKAFGLNLSANPARKYALELAKEEKKPIATTPITLAQETVGAKATIIYWPIFKTAEKQSEFIGYVSGVLRIYGILGEALPEAESLGFNIDVVDVTEPARPLPLLDQNKPHLTGYQHHHFDVAFASRNYLISVVPNMDYQIDARDWMTWLVLTGGLLICALLQAFILTLTGSYELVQKEVLKKTHDLRRAIKEANSANEAKSNFLANMNHELRTPMNAIIGFINLCLKTQLNSQQFHYLKNAKSASETLLALINQSLDFAKIESGHLELEKGNFSVPHIIKKMQALFALQAQERGIQFSIKLESDLPNNVQGDELRVQQIFLNLLSNAFKFTDHGEVTVFVRYQRSDQRLIVSVQDSGVGIPENMIDNIFDAFKQADASTSRRFGGTGLGLSISKRLAQLMGGDIQVTSQTGTGSTFVVLIELPVTTGSSWLSQEDIDLVLRDDPYLNQGEHQDTRPLHGKNVLLVEDVLMNQILAQELLQELGLNVVLADNGKQALDVLSHGKFDVVLMDLQMPVMDGYEATRIIRNDPQWHKLPIIAMTANALESDVEKCIEAGMQSHVAKPIEEEKLVKALLSVLA